MAEQQFPVSITQMHTATLAISEKLAVPALPFTHPFTITIRLIPGVPNLHEIILIDISLMIIRANAGTGRNSPVHQYRTHRHPSLTGKEIITHLSLIVTQKALATIIQPDTSFLARTFYKVHHPTEILVGKL